jgi:hypothetical protein
MVKSIDYMDLILKYSNININNINQLIHQLTNNLNISNFKVEIYKYNHETYETEIIYIIYDGQYKIYYDFYNSKIYTISKESLIYILEHLIINYHNE